jgi:hypothetical protein
LGLLQPPDREALARATSEIAQALDRAPFMAEFLAGVRAA